MIVRKPTHRGISHVFYAAVSRGPAALALIAFFLPIISHAQNASLSVNSGRQLPVLPEPSGTPQLIDSASDPLLNFIGKTYNYDRFKQAVAEAVRRHPSVRQAIAVRYESTQDKAEAQSEYIPKLDVNLSTDRSLARNFATNSDNVTESLRPKSRVDAVLSGEQLIYDFGATPNRIGAASAQVKASEADANDIATATTVSAIGAYYEVFLNQIMVSLSKAFVDRNKEILEDTRFRFQQGYGPAGDIARVESYVAEAEGQVADYQRQLSAASARYFEFFKVDPPSLLDRPAPPPSIAKDYETALSLSHNIPSIRAGEARVLAAKKLLKSARADMLPRISALVDAARYDITGPNHDYDIRGRIVLNHSLSGKTLTGAQTGRAKARIEQAEFAYQRAVDEAEREASIAFRDVEARQLQLETLSRAYIANRRTRDLTVEQIKVSRGNLIDLLRTEREFFDSARQLVQGSAELDLARYVLLSRTGEVLNYFNISLDYNNNAVAQTYIAPTIARAPGIQPVVKKPAPATPAVTTIDPNTGSGKSLNNTGSSQASKTVAPAQTATSGPKTTPPVAASAPNVRYAQPAPNNLAGTVKPNTTTARPAPVPTASATKPLPPRPDVARSATRTPDNKVPPPPMSKGQGATSTASAKGKWGVQLGAFSSPEKAKAHWRNMAAKFARLSGQQPVLMQSGALTRVRTASIFSRDEAAGLCASIQATGQGCFVVAPQ